MLQSEAAQFQLGQLLLRGGLRDAAFKAFENAEVLALRPMTSDRNLRRRVKDVGAQLNVPVCDLAAALAAGSDEGSPGKDLFIDHCHPNAEGHRRLGRALARCIAKTGLLDLGISDSDFTEVVTAMDAAPVDPLRLDQFTGHRRVPGLDDPPLAPADTPLGAAQRGHRAFAANHFKAALAAYRRMEDLDAPIAATALNQALAHLYLGDLASARTALDRALIDAPDDLVIAQTRATLGP
jgi:tetratricopeptide (TPR) repeat protein